MFLSFRSTNVDKFVVELNNRIGNYGVQLDEYIMVESVNSLQLFESSL